LNWKKQTKKIPAPSPLEMVGVRPMEKEKLESLLIDYIDGNLNNAERAIVEKEFASNESTVTLYNQLKEVMDLMANSKAKVTGISLKQNFEKTLQAEISKSA